jgi:hypothetical protein
MPTAQTMPGQHGRSIERPSGEHDWCSAVHMPIGNVEVGTHMSRESSVQLHAPEIASPAQNRTDASNSPLPHVVGMVIVVSHTPSVQVSPDAQQTSPHVARSGGHEQSLSPLQVAPGRQHAAPHATG